MPDASIEANQILLVLDVAAVGWDHDSVHQHIASYSSSSEQGDHTLLKKYEEFSVAGRLVILRGA